MSPIRPRLLQLAFVICSGLFAIIALFPTPIGFINDKLDHVAAFLVLGILVRTAYPKIGPIFAGLGLAAFGGALELLQAVPFVHRDCSIGDWFADLVGISLAIPIACLVARMGAWHEIS